MTCLDVIEEKTGDQTRKTIQIYRLKIHVGTNGSFQTLFRENLEFQNFRKKWSRFRQIILGVSDMFDFESLKSIWDLF